MEEIKPGKYKHFKGGVYEVLGVAKHSETLEEFVVYKHLDDSELPGCLWIRPKKMFLEKISISGKLVSRFEFIQE